MQQLGDRVRERRRSLGLTLADVAERAGVTRGYLSMIENDRLDNPPSGKVLAKLTGALGFGPGELERFAQWARTPPAIRERLAEAEDRAQAGRELAQWLRQVSGKRARGTGKDLDALYRSGQLGRRVNAVLGGGAGGEERGSRIKDRGVGGAVAQCNDTDTQDHPRMQSVGFTPRKEARGSPRCVPAPLGPESPAPGPRDPRPGTPDPEPAPVPLINKVAAGYPAGFTDLGYPARVGDGLVVVPGYTGLHGGNDPDAFAATVCGASMQPDYREGDVVVFSPLADVIDGSDCFVRLEPDHETTFKRVFIDEDAGTLRLQPLNPKYEPRTVDREQVAGMFRAVWRMSRL